MCMATVKLAYSDTLAQSKRCHYRRAHLYWDSYGTGAVAKGWKIWALGFHSRNMLLQGYHMHTEIHMLQELAHKIQECLLQHLAQ